MHGIHTLSPNGLLRIGSSCENNTQDCERLHFGQLADDKSIPMKLRYTGAGPIEIYIFRSMSTAITKAIRYFPIMRPR